MQDRVVAGAAMIVGTSLTIQLAAALAHGLFDQLSPVGVSALRFALGALVLLAVVRPSLHGRERATWCALVGYGVALAALNVTFFEAIDRIPMGVAVTLSFVAPLAMATVASRRRADVVLALLAATGVAVLGGLDPPASGAGIAFAVAAGVAWVAVAFCGRSVGARTRRVDGLALALPVAALVTAPFGVGGAGAVDRDALALGLVIAVVGLIVPFALELEGLRRLEPRVVAVVYSVDPAIAAVVGFALLGERLTAAQIVALLAVTVASVGVTAGAARTAPTRHGHTSAHAP